MCCLVDDESIWVLDKTEGWDNLILLIAILGSDDGNTVVICLKIRISVLKSFRGKELMLQVIHLCFWSVG